MMHLTSEPLKNVGVGTTNTGFLRMGNEIIEYTSVDGNLIGGNIVRSHQLLVVVLLFLIL